MTAISQNTGIPVKFAEGVGCSAKLNVAMESAKQETITFIEGGNTFGRTPVTSTVACQRLKGSAPLPEGCAVITGEIGEAKAPPVIICIKKQDMGRIDRRILPELSGSRMQRLVKDVLDARMSVVQQAKNEQKALQKSADGVTSVRRQTTWLPSGKEKNAPLKDGEMREYDPNTNKPRAVATLVQQPYNTTVLEAIVRSTK
jgi:hypothetical protein